MNNKKLNSQHLYKQQKKIEKELAKATINRHHLMPRSRGGIDNQANVIQVSEYIHKRFHAVFNNLTPREQLLHLLEFNKKAIDEDVYTTLTGIMDLLGEEIFYKDNIIKHETRKH